VIVLRTERELETLRRAGAITGELRRVARRAIQPGVATREIDRAVAEAIDALGASSNFKGYHGFPATVCVSVNEEVVHGIPGDRRLALGDVVSVDLGAVWHGYHGDSAFTVALGEVDARVVELIEATEAAMWQGIDACRPGNRVGDVSAAVEAEARRHGLGVVREFVGHGVGRAMHEEPQVPNYGQAGRGPLLRRGMVLAIEPMFTLGGHEVRVLDDGWTVVTADRSLAAHFEHTVAVGDPPEVLTLEPAAAADRVAAGDGHG
jgi:methionyl aminopeptidase